MADLTTFGANALVTGTPFPETFYVQLHTGDPGPDADLAVATETTRRSFSLASDGDGLAANGSAINWPSYPADEELVAVSLWDADEDGDPWFVGEITGGPVEALAGRTMRIPAGSLVLRALIWGEIEYDLPTPEGLEVTVPGASNEAVVTWEPVPGATVYEVTVGVNGGAPVVAVTPTESETTILAGTTGEYAIAVRATGPEGEISAYTAPATEELTATPEFQEGEWLPDDIVGSIETYSTLWWADVSGGMLIYEIGYDGVDTTHAYVEYQLNESGAPTPGLVHVDTTTVGERFPVRKEGNGVNFVRYDADAEEAGFIRYNLWTDEPVDEVALPYTSDRRWTWFERPATGGGNPPGCFVHAAADGFAAEVTITVINMDTGLPFPLVLESEYVLGLFTFGRRIYVNILTGVDTYSLVVIEAPNGENPVVVEEHVVPIEEVGPSPIATGSDWALMAGGQMWSFVDPLNPVVIDTIDAEPILGAPIAGALCRLNRGPLASDWLVGGVEAERLIEEDGKLLLYANVADQIAYGYMDVSTPEARANLAITDVSTDVGWAYAAPQGRMGAVQTISMVWDDAFYFRWLRVSSTPSQGSAPAGP